MKKLLSLKVFAVVEIILGACLLSAWPNSIDHPSLVWRMFHICAPVCLSSGECVMALRDSNCFFADAISFLAAVLFILYAIVFAIVQRMRFIRRFEK